jgi:FkbM family methyltransferase
VINSALSPLGLAIVNREKHSILEDLFRANHLLESPAMLLLYKLTCIERSAITSYFFDSQSQLSQDLFVISRSILDSSWPKFFVEFSATDGVRLSNTYLLEKRLGWQGILAEPAKVWHANLKSNRNCSIDFRCVSNQSKHSIEFLETSIDNPGDPSCSPELSTMASFADSSDTHTQRRLNNSIRYSVTTVSLNDLLKQHNAPSEIGYLSIETEGSELSILEALNFEQYRFRIITIEHNYIEPERTRIYDLLQRNGYNRVYRDISQWDDCYLLRH